jgi:hypothetical protein
MGWEDQSGFDGIGAPPTFILDGRDGEPHLLTDSSGKEPSNAVRTCEKSPTMWFTAGDFSAYRFMVRTSANVMNFPFQSRGKSPAAIRTDRRSQGLFSAINLRMLAAMIF